MKTNLPGMHFVGDIAGQRNEGVCYYRGTSSCTGKGLASSDPDGHIRHVSLGEPWGKMALRSGRLVRG